HRRLFHCFLAKHQGAPAAGTQCCSESCQGTGRVCPCVVSRRHAAVLGHVWSPALPGHLAP
ncbi:unnamed protein product, partial [Symbiodinium sp. KB8]